MYIYNSTLQRLYMTSNESSPRSLWLRAHLTFDIWYLAPYILAIYHLAPYILAIYHLAPYITRVNHIALHYIAQLILNKGPGTRGNSEYFAWRRGPSSALFRALLGLSGAEASSYVCGQGGADISRFALSELYFKPPSSLNVFCPLHYNCQSYFARRAPKTVPPYFVVPPWYVIKLLFKQVFFGHLRSFRYYF